METQKTAARKAGHVARNLIAIPLTLFLTGCVITEYSAPMAELPTGFSGEAISRSASGPFWQAFRDDTLDRLVAQGLARNLDIKEAVAVIDEAEAAYHGSRSAMFPTFSASASAQRDDAQGTKVITQQTSAGLSISWLLDIFGGNAAARTAALAELEAAKLSEEAARLSVAAAITNSYIELRYYQESIALTRKSIASRGETLKMTRDMVRLGQSGKLEELQAQKAVTQSDAALPALQIGLDRAVNRLATLTGTSRADVLEIVQRGASQPVARGKPSVGVPAEVIRARPDVKLAERRLAAAVARVGVAEAAFWPSVSISGSILPTHTRGSGNVTPWQIGPQINLPIFSGGVNKANLSAAESRAVQAEIKWRAIMFAAIEDVENGLTAWSRGANNVEIQRRLVATSQETANLSRETWRGGEGEFLVVLDAERDLLAAQSSLAEALRDCALAYTSVSVAAAATFR